MTQRDAYKYEIRHDQCFHQKSIVENLKESVRLVEFFKNYMMKRRVQTIYLIQGVKNLKKRPLFQHFSDDQLISRINNLCQVFPDYMQIKKHSSGNLLKVNGHVKLSQIVARIHNLKS